MKPGTRGFEGARFKEAREARGLSGTALADILGVSKGAVSNWETGENTPGPETFRRLGTILNVPEDFFLRPQRADEGPVYFRSQSRATLQGRRRADIRLLWVADLAVELQRELRFPEVRFSPITPPTDPLTLGDEDIEDIAGVTRRYWGLGDGPISNVLWLLENNGALLSRWEIEEPSMDSFSRFSPTAGRPLVYLNADKRAAVRDRFNAVHEAGHLVLHSGVSDDYWSNPSKVKLREGQAHKFASAFLMPAETFSADMVFPALDVLRALKPKWRVSMAAMLMRARDLRLVTEEHMERLFRIMSRNGWRTREPLDDTLEPEQPRLLSKAFQVLAERSQEWPVSVARAAGLNVHDVASLVGLPEDFFTQADPGNLLRFRSN